MSVTTYLGTSSQIQYWFTSCISMGGSSAFGSHRQHWTVKRSLCALAVSSGGVHLSLALIDIIEQWRVHSVFWQIKVGGPSAFGIYLFIYALVYPYIFLLVDCFKWALIGHIEQQRVCSVLWQFRRGVYHTFYLGMSFPYICLWYLCVYIYTGISLYLLISWLFWMGSHWSHWTVKSSLSALAVSNGREGGPLSVLPG